jgi:rhamnosyltransferase
VFDNSVSARARSAVDDHCNANGVPIVRGAGNVGTAGALNVLVMCARELGVEWMVYFDQDTQVDVASYEPAMHRQVAVAQPDIALIGSLVYGEDDGASYAPDRRSADASLMIASGTLMRVRALEEVDGFDESFGLDLVDHEACLRLRSHGWRLKRDHSLVIVHRIGEPATTVFGIPLTRHPLWRREDMWCNSVRMALRYFRYAPIEMLRHLAGRLAETALAIIFLGEFRYGVAAIRGMGRAVAAPRRRPGLARSHATGGVAHWRV